MQVTPVRRPVRPGLACQAVEETSTSKVLRLGRFNADRSSSMRFACFQLCGRVIRYFCLGDAQSILVPEGIAGAGTHVLSSQLHRRARFSVPRSVRRQTAV